MHLIFLAYLPHIETALNTYNMNTNLRIAAFLAQVRHETAGLTTFFQPADNGAGIFSFYSIKESRKLNRINSYATSKLQNSLQRNSFFISSIF